jgi:hypothetical protein
MKVHERREIERKRNMRIKELEDKMNREESER